MTRHTFNHADATTAMGALAELRDIEWLMALWRVLRKLCNFRHSVKYATVTTTP